jgi:hypothetical protein
VEQMRGSSTRGRFVGVAVGAFVLLFAVAPAAAAPKKITGKLSKPGYSVIALAGSGEASSKRARRNGTFKLKPPARKVTLHLRAADGTYAGPVVIDKKGRKGNKAILGVKAGAELGKVKVRNGFAKLKRDLPREDTDRTRRARARKGIPIGARVFGRVGSQVRGTHGSGEDIDRDGIPGALDIDDDGDLILDSVDPPTVTRRPRGPQLPPPPPFSVLPVLSLSLAQTANANHPALAAQIDTALSAEGKLILGATGPNTELDCAGDPAALPPRPGLSYCSIGGTGRLFTPTFAYSDSPRFPECCDPGPGDPPGGDGFGTIPPFMGPPQLFHGATSQEIKTGDWLVARLNDTSGVETGEFTQLLPYVFSTVPALVSYHDSAVPPNQVDISYPYAGGELPVAASPDGDVVVTVTFWRPQRTPIGEGPDREACLDDNPPCEWIDIGGLGYGAGLGAGECLTSAFSETDPNLTDGPPAGTGAAVAFKDSRDPPDQPANPNETLTFTLNITQCLESQGLGSSFDEPGETRMFVLIAAGGGRADQTLTFERQ